MLWGYQIWLEMWLGGMAGGAFLAAFLYEKLMRAVIIIGGQS